MSTHPIVLAQIVLLEAQAQLDLERVESSRAALPGSAVSHNQAMRLHKKAAELRKIRDAWTDVVAAVQPKTGAAEDFDERAVPGE